MVLAFCMSLDDAHVCIKSDTVLIIEWIRNYFLQASKDVTAKYSSKSYDSCTVDSSCFIFV